MASAALYFDFGDFLTSLQLLQVGSSTCIFGLQLLCIYSSVLGRQCIKVLDGGLDLKFSGVKPGGNLHNLQTCKKFREVEVVNCLPFIFQ